MTRPLVEDFYMPEKLSRTLQDMVTVITKDLLRAGIKFWAIGGTLLGCIRDGGQIPYDDDADFGMSFRDYYNKLPKLFAHWRELGYCIFEDGKPHDIVKVVVPDMWTVTQWKVFGTPTVDFFPYKIHNGEYRLYKAGHRKLWNADRFKCGDLFPLASYKYNGEYIPAANNPFEYLDNMYPDWRKKRIVEIRDLPAGLDLKPKVSSVIFNYETGTRSGWDPSMMFDLDQVAQSHAGTLL